MKEILIFAGTTEGRELSECLTAAGILHTLCVATEYGEIVLKEHPFRKVHRGRMQQQEIRDFIQKGSFQAVVDATHPYAEVVTENIKLAMEDLQLPYLRLKREPVTEASEQTVRYFENHETCAKALAKTKGNILLTIGSKELEKYCVSKEIKDRLYVRVLPCMESFALCREQEIQGKQIIAMQGSFTTEMNEAMIHQYGISCLVTKQSGRTGGYLEKLEAARNAGIPVYVIGHPVEEEGYSFGEICGELEKLCKKKIWQQEELQIVLAGIGMGHKNSLTGEVQEAIAEADVLLGAERMLKPYTPRLEKKPFYLAKEILPYLKKTKGRKIVILFSGDSGFYSGCQALYQALQGEIDAGQLKATLRIMPGISSVAYLASCIGESYQDATICSMHGKELYNLTDIIRKERKIFLLMSGVKDVNRLGKYLLEAGLRDCEVVTGYQMSYPEQEIRTLTPEECLEQRKEGLYTCLIKNPKPIPDRLTHGRTDEVFIRGKVPMTKEEVREVSICKLKLHQGAVVYDIGSGTGSIAVEMAGLSNDIQIYAIEQKPEAVSLIRQNKEKFVLENITVVETKAPNGLAELPRATHAFIGGSGGNLKEILQTLYESNPKMRVVLNAISLETISEIKEIPSMYRIENVEILQMQVNRAKLAGQYHLMQAENPVWICAFDFCG